MFACGFWLPIVLGKHRLRYNQLSDIDLYETNINWTSYHVRNESISVLTYSQQQPYHYKYYIGHIIEFYDDFNISDYGNDTTNITNLIQLSWHDFSDYIENKQTAETDFSDLNLHITVYSDANCLSLQQCFDDNIQLPIDYIFTEIKNTQYTDIDSEALSFSLDNARDTFVCIIMLFASTIYFFVIDGIGLWPKRYLEVSVTLIFFGSYFTWILTMSYLPIFNAVEWSKDYGYFGEAQHSIVYFVGHENVGTLWVFGAILSGCSHFFIFLYYPAICVLFAFLSCCICGNREVLKRCSDLDVFILCPLDSVKLMVQLPMLIVMGLSAIGYFGIFIFSFELWNVDTFVISDNTVYAILGVIDVLVVLPIFGCIIIAIGNNEMNGFERKRERKCCEQSRCCMLCKDFSCRNVNCTIAKCKNKCCRNLNCARCNSYRDICCVKHKYKSIAKDKDAGVAELETQEQKL